jgi:hypothetical protein
MTVTTATYTGAVQVAYRVHEMRETPHGPATARAHVLTVDDDPVI